MQISRMASGSVRYAHFAPARLPDIQNSALCRPSAFGALSFMMLVMPSIIMDIATPDSSSCMMLILPRTREIIYTNIIVTAEPINALIESEYVPRKENAPNSIPSVANAAAPLETPSMNGSARLFLTSACIVTPQTARDAPTTSPRHTLGSLRPRIMFSSSCCQL